VREGRGDPAARIESTTATGEVQAMTKSEVEITIQATIPLIIAGSIITKRRRRSIRRKRSAAKNLWKRRKNERCRQDSLRLA
jgi:hypothetical protein